MEQYIPKSVLVTEIERNLYICAIMISQHQDENCVELYKQKAEVYQWMRSFIDTLEVKEVDLEKELDDWRHNHFHGRRDKDANGEWLERISQLELAKHFFELGIAASNKAQKGEKV